MPPLIVGAMTRARNARSATLLVAGTAGSVTNIKKLRQIALDPVAQRGLGRGRGLLPAQLQQLKFAYLAGHLALAVGARLGPGCPADHPLIERVRGVRPLPQPGIDWMLGPQRVDCAQQMRPAVLMQPIELVVGEVKIADHHPFVLGAHQTPGHVSRPAVDKFGVTAPGLNVTLTYCTPWKDSSFCSGVLRLRPNWDLISLLKALMMS